MQHKQQSSKGFTIIELLMAMAFLTFMLVFVVAATVQLFRIYNKGGVIKQLNQSGRTMLEELSRSYRTQTLSTFYVDTAAQRACSAQSAYIWNTVADSPAPNAKNNYSLPDDSTPLRLIRVASPSLATKVCTKVAGKYPSIDKKDGTELLSEQIGVQTLTFSKSVDNKLLNVSLKLSTTDDNRPTFVDGSELVCNPGSAGQFCAQAEFETLIYAPN